MGTLNRAAAARTPDPAPLLTSDSAPHAQGAQEERFADSRDNATSQDLCCSARGVQHEHEVSETPNSKKERPSAKRKRSERDQLKGDPGAAAIGQGFKVGMIIEPTL